ncbi:hypothetical protein sscle_08g068020 [Sclerotinia sclerotiorum 1980 UF-70]|uniref:Uncharacterized protein n=1 Tax=Sclerotinia sclerotiorum (strain ATCC 18683 / 1980 / Ss-1) TaxID=665079 RepID=A0A1D9QB86_SCLS1|nr:hypothetical protein sscle_08g068020 [Sclerotinia sclerotiorum 1980 UF-70]
MFFPSFSQYQSSILMTIAGNTRWNVGNRSPGLYNPFYYFCIILPSASGLLALRGQGNYNVATTYEYASAWCYLSKDEQAICPDSGAI